MVRTVWLASYPKSGNTWFRIFVANLLHPSGEAFDLNALPIRTPIASDRASFDGMLGIPSALLNTTETARLRPVAADEFARTWPERLLLRKVHDAYTWLGDGSPLLGRRPAFSAIYILRNPWDVAVSLANHFSCTLDEAVDHLCDPGFTLSSSRTGLNSQLPQRLLSWAGHACSWLDAPLSVHLMRYEQMCSDPLTAFSAATHFLGLDFNDRDIVAALEASRFERMQKLEAETRFRETPRDTQRFFRKGSVGEGLGLLNTGQLDRLRAMQAQVESAIAGRV